ncbi:MAG: hypothetical protein ACRERD_29715, partial [Candidatus Binatia bacterium]
NWGGASLENWHRALANPFGGHWADFQAVADRHPGTTDLYAEICVERTSLSEASYQRMAEEVFREMRQRLGPGVRIWATGMANGDGKRCRRKVGVSAQIAARLADHVVALGLAKRGPRLTSWQPWETEGGCHPNDTGEDRAAAEIVDFFTRLSGSRS